MKIKKTARKSTGGWRRCFRDIALSHSSTAIDSIRRMVTILDENHASSVARHNDAVARYSEIIHDLETRNEDLERSLELFKFDNDKMRNQVIFLQDHLELAHCTNEDDRNTIIELENKIRAISTAHEQVMRTHQSLRKRIEDIINSTQSS